MLSFYIHQETAIITYEHEKTSIKSHNRKQLSPQLCQLKTKIFKTLPMIVNSSLLISIRQVRVSC